VKLLCLKGNLDTKGVIERYFKEKEISDYEIEEVDLVVNVDSNTSLDYDLMNDLFNKYRALEEYAKKNNIEYDYIVALAYGFVKEELDYIPTCYAVIRNADCTTCIDEVQSEILVDPQLKKVERYKALIDYELRDKIVKENESLMRLAENNNFDVNKVKDIKDDGSYLAKKDRYAIVLNRLLSCDEQFKKDKNSIDSDFIDILEDYYGIKALYHMEDEAFSASAQRMKSVINSAKVLKLF
jgi:hypothetical protein